tara:strand:- start:4459 stop:4800 length:342 start_codon:yes stop_codon:yes gene_type:complete
VVVIEENVTESKQKDISKWLVQSGCLYMMAWGKKCSSWDTSVDLANLELFNYGDIPDDEFVSTTWHEDEPLSEVFSYSKHCAFHSNVDLVNTVVLHLSAVSKFEQYTRDYANA